MNKNNAELELLRNEKAEYIRRIGELEKENFKK